MRRLPFFLLCLTYLGSGCSESPSTPSSDAGTDTQTEDTATADADDGTDAGSEDRCALGAAVFDDGAVHSLSLQLSDADWAAMITEAENSPEYGGPDKTYFNAQMVFDGVASSSPIAVRLKGHYSLVSADGHSFPLKLDFDRVDGDQTLDGLTKINLHPNQEGISALREYISYGAIGAFGVPSARVSFVRVTVNGESLGLYSFVEHIKGKFIRCHYDEPFGDLYKPEEPVGNLNWLGADISDYEPLIQFKWPDDSVTNHASLLTLLDVVNTQPVARFPEVLDVEGVLTYFALNVGLGNVDYYASFGHNYYFYEHVPGRFTMIPWDMNLSQSELTNPCGLGRNTAEWPVSNKLLNDPARVQEYLDILTRFLRGPGSPEALDARIDSASAVAEEEIGEGALEELRARIRNRVDSQLAGIPDIETCPESADQDPCTMCVFDSCEAEFNACDADESCSCMTECIDGGEEAECLIECGVMTPPATYSGFLQCVATRCADEC